MKSLPFVSVLLAANLMLAADKKPEKAKELAPSAAQIQQWIKQLGDKDFKVREEATRKLIEAGEVAFGAVSGATKSKDAEVRQRALRIIKQLAIAYFKKLGGRVTVDENSPGRPVIELSFKRNTKITDAELVHLKGLANLQSLSLRFTNVTDAGLVHLKGLTELGNLDLDGTKITDAGLVHLKGLTKLQHLNLGATQVTDAGLVHLKGLTKLRSLWLPKTKVTDAGQVHLKEFTGLRALNLQHTKVTDAGLVHLKGLANLLVLYLHSTKATQAGIEKLQKALPNCKMRWDGKWLLPHSSSRPVR